MAFRKPKRKGRRLLVRDINTREVVHEVDVSGSSERRVEKVERGMLMRVDLDKYFVDDTGPEGS